MIEITSSLALREDEIGFKTSRAGGPGGQHVNRTESRVELTFDVQASPSLSDSQRARILSMLASRLTDAGVLRIVVSTERSQHSNKQIAIERLQALLKEALRPRKVRKATKPTAGSERRRREAKERTSRTKRERRAPPD